MPHQVDYTDVVQYTAIETNYFLYGSDIVMAQNGSFDCLAEEARSAKNLDELFCLWKQAHEAEENPELTFPQCPVCGESPAEDWFKDSFCEDGYLLSKDEFNGVLFICRESNATDDIGNKKRVSGFWLHDKANDNDKYYKFIDKVLENIPSDYLACDQRDRRRCAFMNLNKRGGYGRHTPNRLKHYCDTYNAFISREIELIDPKIIVCAGTFGFVEKLNFCRKNIIAVYDCYHPSAQGRFKMERKELPNTQRIEDSSMQ